MYASAHFTSSAANIILPLLSYVQPKSLHLSHTVCIYMNPLVCRRAIETSSHPIRRQTNYFNITTTFFVHLSYISTPSARPQNLFLDHRIPILNCRFFRSCEGTVVVAQPPSERLWRWRATVRCRFRSGIHQSSDVIFFIFYATDPQ
jgi:hypothetical protein